MFFHSPVPNFHANLRYWQRTLNLQGWQVSVEVVRVGVLDANTYGDVDIVARDKTATIRILREEDYDLPRNHARADQQLTLVHELVHLKRLNDGDAWHDEVSTVAQTTTVVRKHHRWREAAAIEGL